MMRVCVFLLCTAFACGQGQYTQIMEKACKETGVPYYILYGVLENESNWNLACVSPRRSDGFRDEGIAQINSKYLLYFKWKFNKDKEIDPFSPESAIPVAARILAYNYKYFGTWAEAIAAYRQGVTGVRKKGITHSSAIYVDKVLGGKE